MRRLYLALAAQLVLCAWLPITAPAARAFESPPIELGQGTKAQSLVFDRDGNLWFTAKKYAAEGFTRVIGRVTTGGEVREFPLPKREGVAIGGITVDAGGSVWFADTAADAIGRSDSEGRVTEFSLPRGSAPGGIVLGPDGAIWFTEGGADRLGRIDATGSITTLALPLGAHPRNLAIADGALWVTEYGRNAIARVSLNGTVAEYPLLRADSKPKVIVRSSTGALWFSEEGGQRLGRLYPGGAIVEYDVPGNVRGTGALAAGGDGTIFFVTGSEHAWIEIGSFSSDGELTGLGCVDESCDLPVSALTVGPEGSLWYGTDVAYYGGGGGGALLQPYFPGTVGRFNPPRPAAVSIPRQTLRLRGRFIHPTIACREPSQVPCVGSVQLEARFPGRGGRPEMVAIARRSLLRLAAGQRQRIPCKIEAFAMDVLRRRPLRVTLTAVIHGGLETRRSFTLRPPRRH
jgi:virginiamycin B lyase